MSNFNILELSGEKYDLLVVMKAYEAPFAFLDQLAKELADRRFIGTVLIDELLHSGNNSERFIRAYFDGEKFDRSAFMFENIERRDKIRKISCEMLRNESDIIDYSILNSAQKCLISKGSYIWAANFLNMPMLYIPLEKPGVFWLVENKKSIV